ncbi:MAG: hypothetical protein ACRYFV_13625 [Janthinobacterium lividum]
MKRYLLSALLICSVPALAQTVPPAGQEAGTIGALDAKNGFRKYKFGTPMKEIPGIQKKLGDAYVVPSEELKIGDADLYAILFNASHDKLSSVVFAATGEENCRKVLAALQAQYGPGEEVSPSQMAWNGKKVTMVFELKQQYSAYSSRYSTPQAHKSCTVYISSNAAVIEENAEKAAAAKKAASDL